MKTYPTNLTDNQWQVIEKNHKRARKEEETFPPRDNGRDALHNQDQLPVERILPQDFAPWQTVY
jgi:Spy/CpxP family protein refolding chaperone